MKKIVSAALVASLVAGAAFAEVSISSNFRIRPDIASWNIGDPDTQATYFSLDNTSDKYASGATDTISFKATTDYAGVVNTINTKITGNGFAIDTFYGYLKFGALTLTGGLFDSRIANRVTTDQNNLSFIEQNWGPLFNTSTTADPSTWKKLDNKFAGQKKLGVNANFKEATGVTLIGADSDNISAIEGSKALSFIADYVINNVADGKLQFWAALNKKEADWVTANDDGNTITTVNAAYAFRAAYTKDFTVDADLHIAKHQIIAAAFFNTGKLVDNLNATFGFTFSNDSDAELKAIAFDLRGRYKVSDAFAAGAYLNYTMALPDEGDSAGVLDALVNANYKVNDIVKLFGEVEFVFNANSDLADTYGHSIAAQLGGLFTAGKGAEIDAAVRFTKSGLASDEDVAQKTFGSAISIPVCMRVKL